MKKKIDRNYKTECWQKIIMESLSWLTFLDTMEFTSDRIQNDCNPLPSLLKVFIMFKIKCWWNKKEKGDIKKTVEKVAIRCGNCGK